MRMESLLSSLITAKEKLPFSLSAAGFIVLLHLLLIAGLVHSFSSSIFILVVLTLLWVYVIVSILIAKLPLDFFTSLKDAFKKREWILRVCSIVPSGVLVVFILYTSWGKMSQLFSLGALFIIVASCVMISDNPKMIRWRPVLGGIALQYLIAFVVLNWKIGQKAISFLVDQIVFFLGYSHFGTKFTFGFIPFPPHICGLDGPFSFTVTLGTTAAESLNASAAAFMGPTEAAVLMLNALPTMTRSEIVATTAVSYSMISGSLFAIYISYGACAPLLLAANVSPISFDSIADSSALGALVSGAVQANAVVFAIIANLVVFLAALGFIDASLGYLAELLGYHDVTFDMMMGYAFFPVAMLMGASSQSRWEEYLRETLKALTLLHYFLDLKNEFWKKIKITLDSIALNIEVVEEQVAQLIGTKTVLNEFIAYQKMQGMLLRGEITARGQLISVFALCGYSNPSSIGSQVAQFNAMCPDKEKEFVQAAYKGLLIGILSCLMTACVAGTLVNDTMGCLPPNHQANCLDVAQLREYFLRSELRIRTE